VAASDPAMLVALVELEDYAEVDYCFTSSDPDRRATAAKAKLLEEVRGGSALFADMSEVLAGAWSSHLDDLPTSSALLVLPASIAGLGGAAKRRCRPRRPRLPRRTRRPRRRCRSRRPCLPRQTRRPRRRCQPLATLPCLDAAFVLSSPLWRAVWPPPGAASPARRLEVLKTALVGAVAAGALLPLIATLEVALLGGAHVGLPRARFAALEREFVCSLRLTTRRRLLRPRPLSRCPRPLIPRKIYQTFRRAQRRPF
jgi:hypothetical protein